MHEAFFQESQLFKGFTDDCCRRHGKHSSGKETVNRLPAKQSGTGIAKQRDACQFCDSGDQRCAADTFDFGKIEIKSQAEQNKNNADVRPDCNIGCIDYIRQQVKMRAGKEACQNIA